MAHPLHAHGTHCAEGTRSVPRGFVACCERFNYATQACEFDIRFEWWPKAKSWFVRIPDGGSGGLEIGFCPFCGAGLTSSQQEVLREK
jgi:hypothetical protein